MQALPQDKNTSRKGGEVIEYEENEDTDGACPTMQEQLISMWNDEEFDDLTIEWGMDDI